MLSLPNTWIHYQFRFSGRVSPQSGEARPAPYTKRDALLWRNFLEGRLELDTLLSAHYSHNNVIYHPRDRDGKSLDQRLDTYLAEGGRGECHVEYESPA